LKKEEGDRRSSYGSLAANFIIPKICSHKRWFFVNWEHSKREERGENKRKHQEIEEEDVIKPECVFECDRGNGALDMHEHIHACFPIIRKFPKGYKNIFFYVVNIAFFNMLMIYFKLISDKLKKK
jgi:hypothetical protein